MRQAVLRLSLVLVLLSLLPVRAAMVGGVNPFGDWAGTGTQASNGAGGAAQFHDQDPGTCPYVIDGPTPLTYTETWTEPKSFKNLFLYTGHRAAGGNVYIATTPGGPLTTPLTSFSINTTLTPAIIPVNTTAYGVRVEVNDAKGSGYFQMGEVGFQVQDIPTNVALGQVDVRSPNYYPDGNANSLIDGRIWDRPYQWRAGESGSECWVGFEFADGTPHSVGALRLYASIQHSSAWGWHNPDLQIKQLGVWTSLGQINSTGTSFYWIDFQGNLQVQGVRLYGSTALGNNPVRVGGGLIVDELEAFAVPEPSALALAGLAAAGLIARRRGRPARG